MRAKVGPTARTRQPRADERGYNRRDTTATLAGRNVTRSPEGTTMSLKRVDLAEVFDRFREPWSPKIVGEREALVMLFEPATTLNTGDVRNERTLERLERL
jgi:hypothetical protein